MQTLAILGPTASGKSALALDVADTANALILSLDSLSLYRGIDIASAKPTRAERETVPHFGIDLITPDEPFNVRLFFGEYRRARAEAERLGKNLLIVGGTGFYLKAMLEGISPMPDITPEVRKESARMLRDLNAAYAHLQTVDARYADKIKPADRYRVEKGLQLYLATGIAPSRYFALHPPEPVITETIALYEIAVERPRLRERIALRTRGMIASGLIDEVAALEKRYGREVPAMRAIGIAETLAYLDGKMDLKMMEEKIVTNTARLAKRQQTFNRTQFPMHPVLPGEALKRLILRGF